MNSDDNINLNFDTRNIGIFQRLLSQDEPEELTQTSIRNLLRPIETKEVKTEILLLNQIYRYVDIIKSNLQYINIILIILSILIIIILVFEVLNYNKISKTSFTNPTKINNMPV